MKMITRVNKDISIWADKYQYIVKVATKPGQRIDKQENWYCGSLMQCFQEIFEEICRKRLSDGAEKTIREVRNIILETQKEIYEVMEPFTKVENNLKGVTKR